jgi:hypothetical protein
MAKTTPLVTHIEWGHIEVAGMRLKDAKILPGGAREWDWNQTGTRHVPGIQIADAEELIAGGAEVIVLSRGMELVLQVPATTIEELERRGIEVIVAETRQAVERLNQLARAGRKVGALLHSTC